VTRDTGSSHPEEAGRDDVEKPDDGVDADDGVESIILLW